MTDSSANDAKTPAEISNEAAQSLATELSRARSLGGEERALRDIIANRLRMKKADVRIVYQRFDTAWHAGVDFTLHGGETPALEDDAFTHYAFLCGRGGAAHLIETNTRSSSADSDELSDKDIAHYSSLSAGYFMRRSLIIALVVGALVWWLSTASDGKLMSVCVSAIAISACLGLQAATLIEYLVQIALIALIGAGLAYAGHGEFLLPWLGAGLVGALDGTAQRESQRKFRLARSIQERREG